VDSGLRCCWLSLRHHCLCFLRVGFPTKSKPESKAIKAGISTNPIELTPGIPRAAQDNAAPLFQTAMAAHPGLEQFLGHEVRAGTTRIQMPVRTEAASDAFAAVIAETLEANQTALDRLHKAAKQTQSRYPIT